MALLFETIRIQDGIPCHLHYHEERLNRSREELGLGSDRLRLAPALKVPGAALHGCYRCRVVYERSIESVHFETYTPQRVNSLRLVESDLDYPHKWVDRSALNLLKKAHLDYDDIVISKGGMITDSSISNLVFFDGTRWYTPSTPLLLGTTRARLLAEKKIFERQIRVQDLPQYQQLILINALRDFDVQESIPVNTIVLS